MSKLKLIFVLYISILMFSNASLATALCVSAPEANLRSGPGTNYDKLWEVFKYMPFHELGKKGPWYRVKDVDGDVYWVYSPLVTKQFKCAVVKDEKAYVRTGPGTNYDQNSMSPALRYFTFKVLKDNGQWVNVVDEYGQSGWIFKPLLWIQ